MSERKEILIIKNITREGSGLLGDIIREQGINYKVIDLSRGENIINFPEQYAAVVVCGGPSSANDTTGTMTGELTLIRKVVDSAIPYLGICLGLQTMVKAIGGHVVKSPVQETGFRDQDNKYFNLELTVAGRRDPLFEGIVDFNGVFHLHGETVVLSEKMELLAEGKCCRNQIVKAGTNAYGIQGHFELTGDMFESWINEDPDLLRLDKEQLRSDFRKLQPAYTERGRRLFMNFLRIAGFRV